MILIELRGRERAQAAVARGERTAPAPR